MDDDERDKMIIETHSAVTSIKEKVEDHHADLYGNGKPGLKMDVDRLKTFKKVSCWFFGVMIVASVSIIARLCFSFLTSK